MKTLCILLLQTLVVASVLSIDVGDSKESVGLRRLDKVASARHGRKVRMPYSFGGYVPSFKMSELRSDHYDEPEEDDHIIEHDDDYSQNDYDHSDDFEDEHDSIYHGHHKKKKSHAIVHTHVHKGNVQHKHKHDGEGKHVHKHHGHASHEHKHEGYGKHEHKHEGYGKHEHKHSGHAEHGHHHKGKGEHQHHHSGYGKHEHKHAGHAGHKHDHKGHAEHGHKHYGHGEHEHHHVSKGKHEHSHHGHAGHKHEHKGHADHGHKHSGHGYFEHKHHGHGNHEHKHYGHSSHDHKHHGSGHHSHKHHASGQYHHSHKGKGHVSHKHEGNLKFEDQFKHFFDSSKDEKSHSFSNVGFPSFHSFEHRSEAPSHPDIVFYGSDPNLYNYFVQKKESMKQLQFLHGDKRIDEEPIKNDSGYAHSRMSTTRYFDTPTLHKNGYTTTIEHRVQNDEEDVPENMNRRQLALQDDESDVVYGKPSEDYEYIGPSSQANAPRYGGRTAKRGQNVEGQTSSDAPRYVDEESHEPRKVSYSDRKTPSYDEYNEQKTDEYDYDDRPASSKPRYNEEQTFPSKSSQYKQPLSSTGPQYVESYRGGNEVESKSPYTSDQYYAKDDVYKMHGASYHSGFEPQPQVQEKKQENVSKQESNEAAKSSTTIVRDLGKIGFSPEKGDKPHLIQYNVVHTDSKLPSMSYFSQLRAIT